MKNNWRRMLGCGLLWAGLAGTPRAGAEVMLQFFNMNWQEIYSKIPEIAENGFTSLWLPPPQKASGDLSVGYDLWDPFDIGGNVQRTGGRTRMRTTGMMGEVVGMAASLCRKYDASPRLIYQKHLGELRRLMREGVGRKEGIPDNQKFNTGGSLKAPRALRND